MIQSLKLAIFILACTLSFIVSARPIVLNIYAWGSYLPEASLREFEEREHITVNYTTFDSNESMYTKLKILDGSGYDVVFASSYLIQKMAREGLITRLDHSKLPNIKDIDPHLLGQNYDLNNDYSIPYMWGITGINYNADMVSERITRWAQLWEPQYKQQLMLIDDMRDVFGMALKLNRYSVNSTNPNEIEIAYKSLLKLKDNVLLYNSDAPQMPYISGEAVLGMQWNGNGYQGQQTLPSLKFVMPEEGAILWVDNYTIPSKSEHKELAHKFINFMLEPKQQVRIVETVGYAAPTMSGRSLLPPELRHNKTIFPDEKDIKQGEFINEVAPEALALYERYWQKLRTQ